MSELTLLAELALEAGLFAKIEKIYGPFWHADRLWVQREEGSDSRILDIEYSPNDAFRRERPFYVYNWQTHNASYFTKEQVIEMIDNLLFIEKEN